jgi:nucleoid-associated protein YgaU
VLGSALASGLLSWLAWPAGTAVTDLPATSPDQTLPLLLCLAMSAVSAWVVLLFGVASAARLPGFLGRRAAAAFRHLAPAIVRRAVEVMLGATTVLAVTAGAAQATGPPQRPVAAAAQVAVATPILTGLDRPATPIPDLDRPAADPSRGIALLTSVPTRSPVPQANSDMVTVRTGDSLWRIAARSLPSGAGPRAIERAWHRWYDLNRAVIGANPDLLQPGQRLIPPQS